VRDEGEGMREQEGGAMVGVWEEQRWLGDLCELWDAMTFDSGMERPMGEKNMPSIAPQIYPRVRRVEGRMSGRPKINGAAT